MPKLLPRLYDGFLQGDGVTVRVDTPEWFDWLRSHKGFSVEMPNCRVTFRKEPRDRKEFWYAMRRVGGKLKRRYVGLTGTLVNYRVTALARELAMCDSGDGDEVTQGKAVTAIAPKETEVDLLKKEIKRLWADNKALKGELGRAVREIEYLYEENAELRSKIKDAELHKVESHKGMSLERAGEITEILTPALKLPANRGGAIKEVIRKALILME